jgi:phage terminase small subunit
MLQRGKKSVESLDILGMAQGHRPEPPNYMLDEEKTEWRKMVARMPGGWFTDETLPLLETLCVNIRLARMFEKDLRRCKNSDDIKSVARLTRMHNAAARMVMSLSTKLRLTQQARFSAGNSRTKQSQLTTPATQPWLV